MIKTIWLQVDAGESSSGRTAVTLDVARRFEAHVTGAFLRPDDALAHLGMGPAAGYSAQAAAMIAEHRAALAQAEPEARARFESACRAAGIDFAWSTLAADDAEPVLAAARLADLAVFPAGPVPLVADYRVNATNLAMGSGRPVLILPEGAAAPVGRRILVAWNGSREAARAVSDALALLKTAEAVQVFGLGEGAQDATQALAANLARHGVRAASYGRDGADAGAGEAILRQAADFGADLVVMGLYGRSRLREMVLGGASRTLLRESGAPLLVAH